MHCRTRIKVCGITRREDATAAAALGVDALGFVFWPDSSRYVEPAVAGAITRALPPMVSTVAVFVDPRDEEVQAVLESARIDFIQFHGDEPPSACESFGRPYIKALRMREGTNLHEMAQHHAGAAALLLDTYVEGRPGGTGESFDWSAIPPDLPMPVIVAGGLNARSVGSAVRMVRPYAVDVSGGVESAPGIKNPEKIEALVREVHRVYVG